MDTANNYATWVPGGRGGESETLLGRWIKERGNSSHLFVATKVGFPVPEDEVDMGLTARQIEAECERSLRRLGVETIDLYYAHYDDRETPLEESLEAFHKLVKAGKVGKTLYISGSVSWDKDGNVLGKGDFKVQIRNAYNEIKKTLEAYGATFDNIVKKTLYTTDMEALNDAAPIRAEFFKNVKPAASTWAGVTQLAIPDTLIEIEAIAELP